MKGIVCAIAGFTIAVALVVAAPGTAGAVTSDTFSISGGVSQGNPGNGITVTTNGSTGTLGGTVSVGSFAFPNLSVASVAGGLLTLTNVVLAGGTLNINNPAETDYNISSGSMTLNGSVSSVSIGLSGTFTGGTLAYTSVGAYQIDIAQASYNGAISTAFATLLGLKSTSLSGGLVDLTQQGVPSSFGSLTGEVLLGTNPAPAPVPIPSALLLFGTGLFALAGIRKRFRKK